MSHQRSLGADAADADLAANCHLALSLVEWIAAVPVAPRAGPGRADPFLARRAEFIAAALSSDAAKGHLQREILDSLGWPDLPDLRERLEGNPPPASALDHVAWLTAACADASDQDAPELDDMQAHCLWIVQPLVDAARREALEALSRTASDVDGSYARDVCVEAIRALPDRIPRFVMRAYSLERTIERREQGAPERWGAADRLRFLALYPVLARLLVTRLRAWAAHGVEFAVRVTQDRDDLRSWLGAGDEHVEAVQCGLGDEHAGGRTVTGFTFGGRRVIYKPRPVASLRFLRELAVEMTSLDPDRAPAICVPDVLDCGDYGWVEWIDTRAVLDAADAARFYHRLGQLQALTWVLGATDMHSWNLLACADRPFVLDAETILAPLHPYVEAGSVAIRALAESPVFTGILPQSSGADGESDTSAYGDHVGQRTEIALPVFSMSSDPLSIEWQQQERSVGPAVPRWTDGEPVDPTPHRGEVVEGFRACLRFLLDHRDTLLADDGLLARHTGTPVRVVLRSTADYGQLLIDACHPHLLRDGALRERHFAVSLASVVDRRPEMAQVLRAEIDDLLAGEIPIFYVRAGGCHLFTPDGRRWDHFVSDSPLALVRRRLGGLDARAIAAAAWCVDAALGAYQLNRAAEVPAAHCCRRVPDVMSEPRPFMAAAQAIARRLLSLAHRVGDDLAWFDVTSTEGRHWRVDAGDTSLYRGSAGLLLFFHHLATLAPDREVEAARDSLMRNWLAALDAQKVSAIGAFTGVAGHLYVALNLHRSDGSGVMAELVGQLLDRVDARLDSSVDNDVISGAAGAAIVLARTAEVEMPASVSARARSAMSKCADALRASAEPMENGAAWRSQLEHPVGMAHGSSGVAVALRLLARELPSQRAALMELARQAWLWERLHYVPEVENWRDPVLLASARSRPVPTPWSATWCNGAAGIALARALAIGLQLDAPELVDMLRSELDAGLRSALNGLGDGHTLCHGDAAVADVYLTAGQILDVSGWRDMAERVGAMVAHDVIARTGVVNTGIGCLDDVPGLMSGSAGVGLLMLRLAHPETIPSVLSLAV